MTRAVTISSVLSVAVLLGGAAVPSHHFQGLCAAHVHHPHHEDREWYEERRWVMGTQLRIIIPADHPNAQVIANDVFEEAQRWDALLSNYDPASALSRVNANAGRTVEIPEDLFHYLANAQRNCSRTGGVFDITVGPLVQMYRDGRASDRGIRDALSLVGASELEIQAGSGSYYARLPRIGMALDPGADGKGAALDAMVRTLRVAGVSCAFIDFGGSAFYGLGTPPGKNGWPVAVTGVDGQLLGTLTLKNQALGVSASFRKNLAEGDEGSSGRLAGHIVDPRDGTRVTAPRTAVAVSGSGVDVDVLSTTLVVTGADGLRFCKPFGAVCAAVFEPGREPRTTGDFERYFEPPRPSTP